VTGTPPLTLEIGNTAGVQVSFNDKPVDLAPYTRANVARFTLE
jgi:cytoskeleton protein RodZ